MGRTEDGVGTISTVLGVTMVLAFLLLAAHVLLHLYATSVFSAAAYDAARLASGTQASSPRVAAAHGRALLGSFADNVSTFEVAVDGDVVRARVTGRSPALLPAAFGELTGIGILDEEAVVRRERLVCDDC